ncbi:hypothetical protein M9Y10_014968 [Tritrichomonas musculus]|uniref:Atg6 BARA domain-containing protein n=1 Tax=Tritrichomonas musculus TaxID=1915356 RepID=A0ABR2L136_9EUKA
MSQSEESEENPDICDDIPKDNNRKYIMFVCKKCGSLCMTLPEYFLWLNPGDVIENQATKNKSHEISFSTKSGFLNEMDNNTQKDDENIIRNNIFQNGLKAFLEFSKSPFFPWCLSCTRELEDRVQSRVKFLKNAESFYSQLDIPDKSIFQEVFQTEVTRLDDETSSMKETDMLNTIQPNSDQISLNSESFENLIESQNEVFSCHDNNDENNKSFLFKSLVLPIVFHINVKGTFGTINSLRLGQNINWSISNDELDKSLFFLALLVKNAGRIADVDVSAIKIATDVQIKINDISEDENNKTSRKSDFFSKLSDTFFGKGANNNIITLKASDMRRGRTVSRFNQALDVIFGLSSQIFQSQRIQRDSMMPPNFISPEDHTIADRCYFFDIKDPYDWSHNMRLLLFNYAFLFTFCLRNAILSIN